MNTNSLWTGLVIMALAIFVIGLKTGWSIDRTKKLYQ